MQDTVKQWAGDGARVKARDEIDITPLKLFEVTRPETANKRVETVAVVVDDSGDVLEGKTALKAVVEASLAGDRAAKLAAAVSVLAGDDRPPVSSASDVSRGSAGEKALIKPPRIEGQTLEYWTAAGRTGIRRWRFDLSRLSITDASAQSLLEDSADPVTLAEGKIAQAADVSQRQGVELLAKRCDDPRAMQALLRVATDHQKPATRAIAVEALGGCRHAAAVPTLIRILAGDGFAVVRAAAATAIAAMGKKAAKDAIGPLKAARDNDLDAKVKGAADIALEKLGH